MLICKDMRVSLVLSGIRFSFGIPASINAFFVKVSSGISKSKIKLHYLFIRKT